MMKIITYLTIGVFSLIILTISCAKEKNETIDIDYTSDSTFVIGNLTDGLIVNTFDTTINIIGQPYDKSQYQFDIDDDGNFDFNFLSKHVMSIGGLNYRESSIEILNESIQISVTEMIDTTHRCTSIKIFNDSIPVPVTLFYNNYSGAICSEDGVDTIWAIRNLSYPKIYVKGDTVNFSELWSNEELTLSYFDRSIGDRTSYRILRGIWNNMNMKYILFRINKTSKSYYGWLKISVSEHNEIRFFEYAYQDENK